MEFERLLGKDNPLLKSIIHRGFKAPTEIQAKSIPEILKGNDIIAGAQTGSGKTLAFAAGIIKNVKKDHGTQALVLAPTRELAEQVANEIADFSQDKGLNVISVYGGVSITNQIRRLTSAEIVIGTPGRILDHIERNTINLSQVNTLVLDEADRMLDMGFIDDVDKIIKNCPKKRQTMLFSATISQDISHLSKKYLNNPVEVSAQEFVDPKNLIQVYYDTDYNLKYSLLKYLLEKEKSKLVMIFCNTRRNVDFVANNLKFMGVEAVPIHGGFSQDKRTRILESFNTNKIHVLVATDVAARGLDIKGVTHVYNYDIPPTQKEYIHRIGRTARAGKDGKVINIVVSNDYENFSNIKTEEFSIAREETPYVERTRMRWMPEKKFERNSRRRDMQSNRNSYQGNRRYNNSSDRRSNHYGSRNNEGNGFKRPFQRDNKFSQGNRRFSNDNKSDSRSNWNDRSNRPNQGDRRFNSRDDRSRRPSQGDRSHGSRDDRSRRPSQGDKKFSRDKKFNDKKKFNRDRSERR